MRLTNIIQQLTLAVAFTLVSFTVTAQELPNDEILLVVNDGSIAIDDQYESCGLLLKDSSEDIPHYYLYTSKNYAKHKFGKNRGKLIDWIYVYTVKDGKLAIYNKKDSTTNKFSGIFLDAKREKVNPNPNAKIAIDQNIIIGVVPELGVGEFYFSEARMSDATPVMRLTICRASEFQGAENLKDSAILSVRDGLAKRERGDKGIEVITLSDTSAIDTLDIKIPKNTILREVKIGDSVRQSYIPTETFANDFEKERSEQLCLETSDIGSLLAGKPLTLTYVAFDEKGALNQSITLTYKFTYTEPAPAPVLLWWHYLVAALVLVAILATIGALIWRKRVKSKKEREEREEKRGEKEEEKKKKKHHDDDDDKENQDGDENKESTSDDSATKSDDLEELNGTIKAKDDEIGELNRKIGELNGTIKAKDREIGELNGKISSLEAELSTKSRELEDSQRDLQAAQGALETLKRDIDEKVKNAVEEKEAAHNAEVERLNREHQEAIKAKDNYITGLNKQHKEAIDAEQAKYKELEKQYKELNKQHNELATNWRRDRKQILAFLSSQFEFIDEDIANILGKADPSSPIYKILEQLRSSQYGYKQFKDQINDTLKCEDRAIEELIKDVRAFVMTNMRADMSWINNAARLTAYASTEEFKPVFGHYKDAAKDTKHLFEQIEILLAMWGITNIYIPKLLSTKYNENEHDYSISTLVLPSIFPDYAEHTGNMVIYDFLQVGYMANGEKVKAVIAY